jgi:hypothetical protein
MPAGFSERSNFRYEGNASEIKGPTGHRCKVPILLAFEEIIPAGRATMVQIAQQDKVAIYGSMDYATYIVKLTMAPASGSLSLSGLY